MFFGGGGGFPGFGGHGHDDSPDDKEVDNKEFYDILEVAQTATQDEIKKSYRKKVIKLHPDKGGDPEEFKKLQAAYEVLSNPEKKEIYDKYGIDGLREDGGSGMDPFEGLFGGLFGGRGQQQQRKVRPIVKELEVTLEDVYLGKMKNVTFDRQRCCAECNGKGAQNAKKCTKCKGNGTIEKLVQVGPNMMTAVRQNCSTCSGEGMIFDKKDICKVCKGGKVKKESKTLEVPIEIGAPEGMPVQFSSEGNEIPDVQAGDFVVKLIIKPHKRFERKGADLYYTKKISLYEALTGFAFNVEHLDGKKYLVTSEPKEIITPGLKKQIRNLGMPFYRDNMSHGNLYVIFDVEFPKAKDIKNHAGLKEILPVPKDLITNYDKNKSEILEDFDPEGVNERADGAKPKKQQKGGHPFGQFAQHFGGHDDDEDMPRGGAQTMSCNQQ